MKKLKRNDPLIVELMINKQLEKYGINFNNVKDYPEFNGVPWYQNFTFDSKDEFEQWKEYCIHLMTHKISPRFTLKSAEKEFMWFNLMFGLKLNYND